MSPPDDPLARLLRRAASAPPRATAVPAALEATVLRAWRTDRAAQAARPRGLLAFLSLDGLLAPALGGAAALLATVLVWTAALPEDSGNSSTATRPDGLTAEIEELVTEPTALLAYENS